MVNRNYVKGRAFEHQVRKHYESKGYTVIRSAGSKGKIDLIAWTSDICNACCALNVSKHNATKVIQCKIYAAKATKPLRTDLELLRAVQVPSGWQRVLAWRVHGEKEFKEEVV